MKPHTAPTSPKYPHEQRLQDVWHEPKMQQPVKVPTGTIIVFSVLSSLLAVSLAWGALIWMAIAYPNSFLVKALPSSVTTIIQSVPNAERATTTPTAVTRIVESVVSIVPEKAVSPITGDTVVGQGVVLTSNGWVWAPRQSAGVEIKTATATATFGVMKTIGDALTPTVFLKTTQGGGRAIDIVDPESVTDGEPVWVISRRLQSVSVTPKRLRITGVSSWQACERYHQTWEVDGGWGDSVGGMVVDEKGRLIGAVGTNGVIIAADMIQPVLDRVLQQNDASRPSCGFRVLTSTDVLLSKNSNDLSWIVGAKGADVAITPKSPAETAGLKAGDKITKIDGDAVSADPGRFFRALKIGQTVKLDVLRGTTKVTLTLKTSSLVP